MVGRCKSPERRLDEDAMRYETCIGRQWVIGSMIQRRRLTIDSQYSSHENETRRYQANPLLNRSRCCSGRSWDYLSS